MTRDGRPTLGTVAAAAGVSLATVSKVLNDREDVGAATRLRVQQLLDQYEYVPPRRAAVSSDAEGRRPIEPVVQSRMRRANAVGSRPASSHPATPALSGRPIASAAS